MNAQPRHQPAANKGANDTDGSVTDQAKSAACNDQARLAFVRRLDRFEEAFQPVEGSIFLLRVKHLA